MDNYTWNADYTRGYAETADPRVIVIVEVDEYAEMPDGDAFAPALLSSEWRDNERHARVCDSVYVDHNATDAVQRAFSEWGAGSETARRYLRIFHGIEVHLVTSSIDRYDHVWLIDSPAWREHTGARDATADIETWR